MYFRRLPSTILFFLGVASASAQNLPISSKQLPLPTTSTPGVVYAGSAPSGQFLTGIGTNGHQTYAPLTSAQIIAALGYTPPSSSNSVTSFDTRTGVVTLLFNDVTTALGYTPLSSAATVTIAGKSLSLNSGSISLSAADLSNGTTGSGAVVLASGGTFSIAGATGLTSTQVLAALGSTPLSATTTTTVAGKTLALNGGSVTLSASDLTNGITGTGSVVLSSGGVFSIASATGLTSTQVTSALGFTPVSASSTVVSFDGRSGAVTLTSADVTAALGFTPASTSSSVVTSFNTRNGSVTLTSTDVTTALAYTPAASNASLTIAGHVATLGGTTTLAASDMTNGTTGTGSIVLASGGTFSVANATGLTSTQVTSALGFTPAASSASVTIAGHTVTLGGSASLSFSDLIPSFSGSLTATGSNQSGALSITSAINVVTNVSPGTGVKLVAASVTGTEQTIVNASSNALSVYPNGTEQINTYGASAPAIVAAGGRTDCWVNTSTQWYCR